MRKTLSELKKDIVFETELSGRTFTLHSTWGLFSPERVDEGSALLLRYVEVAPRDTILDLGCGYGALGLPLAARANEGVVHLIDKDFVAVDYAKKNAQVNHLANTEVYLSNLFSAVPAGLTFDTIVSNLPAKASKELYDLLFLEAKVRLRPGGKLYVVTIAGLKEFIKKNFIFVFGNYDKLKQSKTYIAAVAVKE